MSKAERYIELVSDENGNLCDQHALKAVEIAREELLEEICVWLKHLQVKPTYFDVDWLQREWYFERDKLIEDLKQAMRDE